MTTSSNDSIECQVYCGPFVLSFGDVHRQAIHAKSSYRLTDNEAHILQAFIQVMPRPGYYTHLGVIFEKTLSFWSGESGLLKQNLSRAFKGLSDKKVIVTYGVPGKKQRHFMHPQFAQRVLEQKVRSIDAVEKEKVRNQSDYETVIKLITDCNQSDYDTVINLITDGNQSDYDPIYIEDPFLIPEDSLSQSRSNPAVDMWITQNHEVDAAAEEPEPEEVHIEEEPLAQCGDLVSIFESVLGFDSSWYGEKFVEMVTAFGIEENHPGILADFADSLIESQQKNLDVARFGLLWTEWRKGDKYRLYSSVPNIDHITDTP